MTQIHSVETHPNGTVFTVSNIFATPTVRETDFRAKRRPRESSARLRRFVRDSRAFLSGDLGHLGRLRQETIQIHRVIMKCTIEAMMTPHARRRRRRRPALGALSTRASINDRHPGAGKAVRTKRARRSDQFITTERRARERACVRIGIINQLRSADSSRSLTATQIMERSGFIMVDVNCSSVGCNFNFAVSLSLSLSHAHSVSVLPLFSTATLFLSGETSGTNGNDLQTRHVALKGRLSTQQRRGKEKSVGRNRPGS